MDWQAMIVWAVVVVAAVYLWRRWRAKRRARSTKLGCSCCPECRELGDHRPAGCHSAGEPGAGARRDD